MSAQVNGPAGQSDGTQASLAALTPAALEEVIQERRNHLAATIDELTTRAQPKEIARRTVLEVQRKLRTLTHGPDGQVRTERLAAIGGAVAVAGAVLILLR